MNRRNAKTMKSLYAESRRGVPQIVFWQGSIKAGGTAGDDYMEIVMPLKDVERLLGTYARLNQEQPMNRKDSH